MPFHCRENRYKPYLPIVACERFMLKHLAAYGGHHKVPAIMYMLRRNKYVGVRRLVRPCFAYEYR